MKIEDDKLQTYIKSIMPPACPLCGNKNWGISDTVFQLMEFEKGTIKIGGQLLPLVPITCNKCGNTYLINAIKAGFIEQPLNKNEE